MKGYKEFLAEERAIYEALDDTNKEIVDGIKKYFKGAYNFPNVRFKTVNNKVPHLTVKVNGDNHTFNAADLNGLLQAKGGKAQGTFLRADYMSADLNHWGAFLKSMGTSENV